MVLLESARVMREKARYMHNFNRRFTQIDADESSAT